MIDLEDLERQLAHKSFGQQRRVHIISRAEARLDEERAHAQAEIERLRLFLEEEPWIRERLAGLRERFGFNKRTLTKRHKSDCEVVVLPEATIARNFEEVGLTYEGGPVVMDAQFPFKRIANGFLVRNPLEAEGEIAAFTPLSVDLDLLRADHRERVLMVPGYASLCHMVQVQWLDPSVLDKALDRAISWDIVGHTNAPDLAGYIVQAGALEESSAAAAFWSDRWARLEALGQKRSRAHEGR